MMSVFYQEVEEPAKNCKCPLASTFKDAFAKCHSFPGNLHSTPEPEEPPTDFDQEEEVLTNINSYIYINLFD